MGDFDPVTKTGTDNQAAIQSAIEFCAAHGKKLRITSGLYGVWNNGATRTIDKTSSVYNGMKSGGLDLCDGSVIEWDDDAWLIQMFPTATGSFLANSNTGIFHPDSADYKSSNITLIQPQIDGSYLELWNTAMQILIQNTATKTLLLLLRIQRSLMLLVIPQGISKSRAGISEAILPCVAVLVGKV